MEIKRTANAGVLLTLDGKRILLDGVCGSVAPYMETPEAIRQQLLQTPPDALAFTHAHEDHYDALFVSQYVQETAGPVLGPAEIPYAAAQPLLMEGVSVQPVETQHLGKGQSVSHCSFVIRGSRCVWFAGDASPESLQSRQILPPPDILVAPYSYAIGHGWQVTKSLAPRILLLLHLPERHRDIHGLWSAVEQTVGNDRSVQVLIPAMGEKIQLK